MFRFSCRKYLDKKIPEGVLERILGYSQVSLIIEIKINRECVHQ